MSSSFIAGLFPCWHPVSGGNSLTTNSLVGCFKGPFKRAFSVGSSQFLKTYEGLVLCGPRLHQVKMFYLRTKCWTDRPTMASLKMSVTDKRTKYLRMTHFYTNTWRIFTHEHTRTHTHRVYTHKLHLKPDVRNRQKWFWEQKRRICAMRRDRRPASDSHRHTLMWRDHTHTHTHITHICRIRHLNYTHDRLPVCVCDLDELHCDTFKQTKPNQKEICQTSCEFDPVCVCVCVCGCVCVCVCVCMWERERERESVCVCIGVFIHVVGTRLPFGDKMQVPIT